MRGYCGGKGANIFFLSQSGLFLGMYVCFLNGVEGGPETGHTSLGLEDRPWCQE